MRSSRHFQQGAIAPEPIEKFDQVCSIHIGARSLRRFYNRAFLLGSGRVPNYCTPSLYVAIMIQHRDRVKPFLSLF